MLSRRKLNWELFKVMDSDIKEKSKTQSKDFQLRLRTTNIDNRGCEINLKITH